MSKLVFFMATPLLATSLGCYLLGPAGLAVYAGANSSQKRELMAKYMKIEAPVKILENCVTNHAP
jgi:hypothetical protein